MIIFIHLQHSGFQNGIGVHTKNQSGRNRMLEGETCLPRWEYRADNDQKWIGLNGHTNQINKPKLK